MSRCYQGWQVELFFKNYADKSLACVRDLSLYRCFLTMFPYSGTHKIKEETAVKARRSTWADRHLDEKRMGPALGGSPRRCAGVTEHLRQGIVACTSSTARFKLIELDA
jgi:hypothetical protein